MVAERFASLVFDFESELANLGDEKLDERVEELKRNDRRFKTVVCRHWVKGLCMKTINCEFLHELNPDRMPECRWGEKCQVPDCMFKHTKEQDRLECTYYALGFCMHGSACRYRHVRKAPEECPKEVSWEELPSASAVGVRRVTEPNENFKTSLCKHFETTGNCPFGDKCHYAHGKEELRAAAPKVSQKHDGYGNGGSAAPVGPNPLDKAIKELQSSPEAIPHPLGDSGNDLSTPDIDQQIPMRNDGPRGPVAYFIMRSNAFEQLAASIKHGIWSVHPDMMSRLNDAFFNAKRVILLFTVNDQKQFVGCAYMTGPVEKRENLEIVDTPEMANGVSFIFPVEWTRAGTLSYGKTAMLQTFVPELNREVPVAFAFEGSSLPSVVGHALLVMLYREAEVTVPKDAIDPSLKVGVHFPGPAPFLQPILQQTEQVMSMQASASANMGTANQTKTVVGADGVAIPVAPGSVPMPANGFVFICRDPRYLDEMLGRCLFGAMESDMAAVADIKPGMPILLLNLQNGMLFGIFEAVDTVQKYLEPDAFMDRDMPPGPNARCHLPLQLPCKVLLNAPPFPIMQVPGHILPKGHEAIFKVVDIGKMQQLANLFAIKGGLGVADGVQQNGQSDEMANFRVDLPPGVTVHDPQEGGGGNISQKILINIPFKPQFKAAHRLIGKQGANVKRIRTETGCKVKVQSIDDTGNSKEITGPMEFILITKEGDKLPRAVEITKEIIDDIVTQHEEYLARGEQMRIQRMGMAGGPRGPPRPPPRGDMPPHMFMGGPPPMGGPPMGPPMGGPPRGPPRGPPHRFHEMGEPGSGPRGPPGPMGPMGGKFSPFDGPPPRRNRSGGNEPVHRQHMHSDFDERGGGDFPQGTGKRYNHGHGRQQSDDGFDPSAENGNESYTGRGHPERGVSHGDRRDSRGDRDRSTTGRREKQERDHNRERSYKRRRSRSRDRDKDRDRDRDRDRDHDRERHRRSRSRSPRRERRRSRSPRRRRR